MTPHLAPYHQRIGAFLLDVVVVLPALVVVGSIVGARTADQTTLRLVLAGAFVLTQLVYPPLFLARSGQRNGQTLGKQWVGIRVLRADHRPVDLATGLLRDGLGKGVLSLVPFFNIVDLLFPLGDRHAQSIHDKIASTYVVTAAKGTTAPARSESDRMGAWAEPPPVER